MYYVHVSRSREKTSIFPVDDTGDGIEIRRLNDIATETPPYGRRRVSQWQENVVRGRKRLDGSSVFVRCLNGPNDLFFSDVLRFESVEHIEPTINSRSEVKDSEYSTLVEYVPSIPKQCGGGYYFCQAWWW
jgi:hypothetical protein